MFLQKLVQTCTEKVKSIKPKALAVLAFSILASAGVLVSVINQPASIAEGQGANTPRFNFLQGDQEMLRVANESNPVWSDPANAQPGDRVAFLVYYHNGILDSTAHNTKVRVDLPLTQSNQLEAKSWLWSDETNPITDTIVDSQIVGLSGATINLPTQSRIDYEPNSTKLYANNSQTGVSLPDGIVSEGGVNIGNINGCWQYAGFVTFVGRISGPASLVMDKTVAHPGDTVWHNEISANPGDDIAYHLGIRNDGGSTASNVSVKDILPAYMSYETGTTYIYTKDHPEGIKQADTLFDSGISLGNVTTGNDGIVYVTYRVKLSVDMPAGAFVLSNIAKVYANGVEQDQAQAKVYVSAERGLIITKHVSNGVSWVKQSTAKLGDTLTYRVVVRNTGNVTLQNVTVRDILPVFVRYTNGSTKIDNVQTSDDIVTANGLFIENLAVGEQKTITLSGYIYGCPPIGGYDLINTAYAKSYNVSEISDSADTIVNVSSLATPGFSQ